MLITGIGGGIGDAILQHFLSLTKKIITASRSKIPDHYSQNHTHYQLDLTVESNVLFLFEKIKEENCGLDIMINTIGGSLYTNPIEDFGLKEFQEILNVNLTSAFLLTRSAIKIMKMNTPPHGNIVHFVSSSTKRAGGKKGPYGIAKAGLVRLIQYTAEEISAYNIKINGINPTYVFTPRHEKEILEKAKQKNISREKMIEHILSTQILKRPLFPNDLIPMVKLLASTEIVTGQVFDASLGEINS